MILAYPAVFQAEPDGGYVVRFPDLPFGTTQGNSRDQAMAMAEDALQCVLWDLIRKREEIPEPKQRKGRNVELVKLPSLLAPKVELYRLLRSAGISKQELARRLGVHGPQVDRLLDLRHVSKFDQLDTAFRVLGKKLVVEVKDSA
jgi:antitoxin HicB